ncbi:CobW family GTP-binding protein [Pseudorhodoferax sp.]|uniref:CobW family GTP-binding protein n=1 Tax=Pseudorhodoferax sp. TaxID=1993553 RepID=UPI002DD6450E|nr:CobW family GTP-binding protein [Pseudorhodoferax sp.]
MNAALPLVVIGGYLGAGKTTLVNHLLRHAGGRRIAVLVNDFGDVDIDAALISAEAGGSADGVISLAGGCLCCSFGDDLIGTVQALRRRTPAPELCLVELSGVALPATVVQTLALASELAVIGTLVLADATQVQRQVLDRYVGDTVSRQLQQADWLVLNKAELADAATLQRAEGLLAELAPRARVMRAAAAALPPELVFGWRDDDGGGADAVPGGGAALGRWAGRPLRPAPADTVFASRSLPLPQGADLHALGRALAQPAHGVLRAKGIVRRDDGSLWVLQLAAGRWQVAVLPAGTGSSTSGRLVVIGLRAHASGWPQDWLAVSGGESSTMA